MHCLVPKRLPKPAELDPSHSRAGVGGGGGGVENVSQAQGRRFPSEVYGRGCKGQR